MLVPAFFILSPKERTIASFGILSQAARDPALSYALRRSIQQAEHTLGLGRGGRGPRDRAQRSGFCDTRCTLHEKKVIFRLGWDALRLIMAYAINTHLLCALS